jgi:hypothetical protein
MSFTFAEAVPERPAMDLRHDFKAKHIGLPSPVLKSAPKPRAVV